MSATHTEVLQRQVSATHLEVLERLALDAPVADVAVAFLLQQGPSWAVP